MKTAGSRNPDRSLKDLKHSIIRSASAKESDLTPWNKNYDALTNRILSVSAEESQPMTVKSVAFKISSHT